LSLTPSASSLLADSDIGKGSPIGLLVVLLLIVAVYFLYRSMNRHLRKVPPEFDPPSDRSPSDRSPSDRAPDANRPPAAGPSSNDEQPQRQPDRPDDDTG
jgi:hypothetical protein